MSDTLSDIHWANIEQAVSLLASDLKATTEEGRLRIFKSHGNLLFDETRVTEFVDTRVLASLKATRDNEDLRRSALEAEITRLEEKLGL